MGERLVDAQRRNLTLLAGNGHLCLRNSSVSSSVTAAAGEATANTISASATFVYCNSTNDDHIVYLPSPADVPDGKVYFLVTDVTKKCELSSKWDGTTKTTINGVEVTNASGEHAAELELQVNCNYVVVKTGANAWTVTGKTPDA